MAGSSPTDPTLSPILLAALATVVAVFGRAARSGWRTRQPASRWRAASCALGVALLAVAFVSPLATLSRVYLLSAHLVQVTLVMGFVPPLLLLSLPPVRRVPALPHWLRTAARWTVHPGLAIVLVNAVFFGWHAPVLYDAALRSEALNGLEQVSLLAVSLAFWWCIVEPDGAGRWSLGPLLKLGYILLATIPQTFAGLLFALAHRPFYAPYVAAPRVLGLDVLTDQEIAGACMALLSKLALFGAFSVILWRLLSQHEPDGEAEDDGGFGRDDDDAPLPVTPGTPAWLLRLETGPVGEEPEPVRREGIASAG